jgi:hypothetical protein
MTGATWHNAQLREAPHTIRHLPVTTFRCCACSFERLPHAALPQDLPKRPLHMPAWCRVVTGHTVKNRARSMNATPQGTPYVSFYKAHHMFVKTVLPVSLRQVHLNQGRTVMSKHIIL